MSSPRKSRNDAIIIMLSSELADSALASLRVPFPLGFFKPPKSGRVRTTALDEDPNAAMAGIRLKELAWTLLIPGLALIREQRVSLAIRAASEAWEPQRAWLAHGGPWVCAKASWMS